VERPTTCRKFQLCCRYSVRIRNILAVILWVRQISSFEVPQGPPRKLNKTRLDARDKFPHLVSTFDMNSDESKHLLAYKNHFYNFICVNLETRRETGQREKQRQKQKQNQKLKRNVLRLAVNIYSCQNISLQANDFIHQHTRCQSISR